MHIIYIYIRIIISGEFQINVDYTNAPTIISNTGTIGVEKYIFIPRINGKKKRESDTVFVLSSRKFKDVRDPGKEDWQEAKFNHPRLLPLEGSEKKKRRETEMNRFGHGGRQKRLIIGQVRVKVENLSAARPLESIVRKVSCDIPVGRGERLSKKKEKKKGDASDKKTGFRLEIKLFIVSPFRGHCGETINGNKIRLIARKSSPVRRFRFISDDDLTRFQNLFRISPFFFPSFFFIFNFFLLSFFLLHYVFRRRS